MRVIKSQKIRDAVAMLCVKANLELRPDVLSALKRAWSSETNTPVKEILGILIENARLAKIKSLPLCQDTGIAIVFVDIGEDVNVAGGLARAIIDGVRDGYRRGYLRKSVVSSPLLRKNTNDNTPPVIHYNVIPGRKIKLTVMPKGFGCENVSALAMLKPTAGIREVKDFVVGVVQKAGPNACPPYVVGVGIGGTADYAMYLAKKALLHKVTPRSRMGNIYYTRKGVVGLEKELLREINRLNIGPMGFGGRTTALGVKILTYPTHIAGLPVAVNISCHALRSAIEEI